YYNVNAETAVNIETYNHCSNPGEITLTFEDGPDVLYTESILDILKKENVKTTFFVNGKKDAAPSI
ncbi:hypothetical protein BCR36DRAFT_416951, partial [Piromyces finnis]